MTCQSVTSPASIAVAAMIIVLSAFRAHAGLRFERTSIDLEHDARETKQMGVFRFKNDGDRPVTILAVRSCCGCTTTDLQKRVYQSGEAGEIRVFYSPGSETGERRKSIEVVSDDTEFPTITLELRATIEPAFRIASRIASWQKGDPTKPREIEIEIRRREPLELTSVVCSSDKVKATLVQVVIGRRYKLTVVPKSTQNPVKALITVRGREENSPMLRVLAMVRETRSDENPP